jgi:hypothetical protein
MQNARAETRTRNVPLSRRVLWPLRSAGGCEVAEALIKGASAASAIEQQIGLSGHGFSLKGCCRLCRKFACGWFGHSPALGIACGAVENSPFAGLSAQPARFIATASPLFAGITPIAGSQKRPEGDGHGVNPMRKGGRHQMPDPQNPRAYWGCEFRQSPLGRADVGIISKPGGSGPRAHQQIIFRAASSAKAIQPPPDSFERGVCPT